MLTFPAVSSSDDARYYCLATGALGRSVGSWTSRLKVVNDGKCLVGDVAASLIS